MNKNISTAHKMGFFPLQTLIINLQNIANKGWFKICGRISFLYFKHQNIILAANIW